MTTTAATLGRVRIFLEMIKFEHTIFALPFAVLGGLLACRAPGPHAPSTAWLWMLLCVVAARTAAMAFNRIADAHFDARNPRTRGRALPKGLLTRRTAWAAVLAASAVFVASAGMLNRACLYLSPAVLGVLLGYSYAKRFTVLCHVWLGICLALAPVGAWLAMLGRLELPPVMLGAAVMLCRAGFDIIYACQDTAFDRRAGVHSLPAALGVAAALRISAAMHAGAVLLLAFLPACAPLGAVYAAGLALAAAAIVYQHAIVRPSDLSRVNAAFFTANGVVSIGLLTAGAIDLLLL